MQNEKCTLVYLLRFWKNARARAGRVMQMTDVSAVTDQPDLRKKKTLTTMVERAFALLP